MPLQPRAGEIADFAFQLKKRERNTTFPLFFLLVQIYLKSSHTPPTASLLDAVIVPFLLELKKFPLRHVLPRYNRYLLPHNCWFPSCPHTRQTARGRETRDVLPGCPEDAVEETTTEEICYPWAPERLYWRQGFYTGSLSTWITLLPLSSGVTCSPGLSAPSRSHFTTTNSFTPGVRGEEKKKKGKRNPLEHLPKLHKGSSLL